MKYLKRNHIILIAVVAIVAVVLVFPTPHTRVIEFLVKTFDCSTILQDGNSISQSWVDMHSSQDSPYWNLTRVVIDIQSIEEVEVSISNGTVVLYSYNHTIHAFSGIFSSNSYIVSITNPIWSGTGLSADMTGNIKAYHFDRETEWLPWWMPARALFLLYDVGAGAPT